MTPHLLVAISSHGYGHLAQIAPVINASKRLAEQRGKPGFDVTIRTSLPKQQIEWRINHPFAIDPGSDDFGMVMVDALSVDLPQSLRRYADLHRDWHAHVDRLAKHMDGLKVDTLLADAPYLSLAAAQAGGIPAIAVCSLNWADILERCVQQTPGALELAGVSPMSLSRILQQMRDAYASATFALRPEPAIQTSGFETITIDPLADHPPAADRQALAAFVKEQTKDRTIAQDDYWMVLASMGGIELPLQPDRWPTQCLGRRVIYLVDPTLAGRLPHTVAFDLQTMPFQNMMASCDLVLTKPGYGMFVESRVCGKPMLYLTRDQWPESQCLIDWANKHASAMKLTLDQVSQGSFDAELARLLGQPKLEPTQFAGATQAAEYVLKVLY